ncbi:MAG: tyrosine-protein phosphatase [Clostridia bacterium]
MHLKHIPMDGPQNFRDLGGFMNQNGKAVKWNILYRSDAMSTLSQNDCATLEKLNIKTVIDLRGSSEQKAMPNHLPEGVRTFSCPMIGEEQVNIDHPLDSSFAKSLKMSYLNMIGENAALIGTAVKHVIESIDQGAVVFHCTAGKDRTGVLAAVLFLLLGVSEEDITADYQVSYTYNAKGINRMAESIPQLMTYIKHAGEDSMLKSQPQNIQGIFETLNEKTISQWLEDAGVDRRLQQHLQASMLEA